VRCVRCRTGVPGRELVGGFGSSGRSDAMTPSSSSTRMGASGESVIGKPPAASTASSIAFKIAGGASLYCAAFAHAANTGDVPGDW